MTQQEFDKTSWSADMMCTYHGESYDIDSVDFGEKLVGLQICDGSDDLSWVRCENISQVA